VLSFTLAGYRPQEVGALLSQAGHRGPRGPPLRAAILRRFGVEETVRAALAMYNAHAEIDALTAVLLRDRQVTSRRTLLARAARAKIAA